MSASFADCDMVLAVANSSAMTDIAYKLKLTYSNLAYGNYRYLLLTDCNIHDIRICP